MRIFNFLPLFSFVSLLFLFTIIEGFDEPSPAPVSGADTGSLSEAFSSPPPAPLSVSPEPMTAERAGDPVNDEDEIPAVEEEEEETEGGEVVRWCAVGEEEYEDCQYLVSVIKETSGYTWECVNKDTTQQCLESIKNGEADLINLEAGMTYTAFITYSMKAIANEVYCDQAKSYDAVAIVNRKSCKEKENFISLKDFKGHKSCHGGYSTASGWNYPINRIITQFSSSDEKMTDQETATNFFSKVCAPSEFEGVGICSGCGDKNGTCHADSNSLYRGHSGAFRCLVEELGDVAFVKGDTALLYSMEGPYNQSWSTKSIREFMYLCPEGGCREINGYPGSCSFGTVPANAIMTRNSIPNNKRLLILQALSNVTWGEALHARKSGASHLLSPSTQQLTVVKKLTRSYLGKSASVSQGIQKLNTPEVKEIPSTLSSDSDTSSSSRIQHDMVIKLFSVLTTVMQLVFTAFAPR